MKTQLHIYTAAFYPHIYLSSKLKVIHHLWHFLGKKTKPLDKSQWLTSQVNTRPRACVTTAWFPCLSKAAIALLLSSLICPHEEDSDVRLIALSRLFAHSLTPPPLLLPVCNIPLYLCVSPPLLLRFIISTQGPVTQELGFERNEKLELNMRQQREECTLYTLMGISMMM